MRSPQLRDDRPLLARIVNPGVPWWVVLPCNFLAALAMVLLVLDPHDNLPVVLWLLGPVVNLRKCPIARRLASSRVVNICNSDNPPLGHWAFAFDYRGSDDYAGRW
jgi:hypothetical protein